MDWVFHIVAAAALGAGALAIRLIWLARKPLTIPNPCCATPPATAKPAIHWRNTLQSLLNALTYLRTSREWRYKAPWVLLLGERSAGKSSLVASISADYRQAPDWRQQELGVDATQWQFFDQGLLIDPDGRLSSSEPGTEESREWQRFLDLIDRLRPERALDGLLLAISARTLRTASTEKRVALATNAYQQLCTIQERFEFALPVYVVVTECDIVDGFTAFWQAMPNTRREEIFGWSAPAQAQNTTPEEWANATFDTLSERLRTLQIDAAAERDCIADADRFFLFPRHFQQLRAPFKHWLSVVFQPSAWHAGFFCRGIYFTGSIAPAQQQHNKPGSPRNDIAFVTDLITQKVLAEPHLARPTRKGIWSRNKLIRSLQGASIALVIGMAIALTAASNRLDRQLDALIVSLDLIRDIRMSPAAGETCIGKERAYELIEQIARIEVDSMHWAIPASWIDFRATNRSANLIANAAFERVIFPSLACQLESNARQLLAQTPKAATTYTQSRQALFDYLQAVQALELNIVRFRNIAAATEDTDFKHLMREFADLSEYAYGSPLPAAVTQERGALSHALADVEYNTMLQLPANMQQRFSTQISQQTGDLHRRLFQEIQAGSRLLGELSKAQGQILDNSRHFAWWLTWVQQSWLGSTPANNPCKEIHSALQPQLNQLAQQFRYPDSLKAASNSFNATLCYQPAMSKLTELQFAPYGALFTRQNKVLGLNPALAPELTGLSALIALDFMRVTSPRPFLCQSIISGWRSAELGQTSHYLNEYQEFTRKQGLKPLTGDGEKDKRPLYDQLARHQLESVLNSTMRDAQWSSVYPSLQRVSLDFTSLVDQQLSQESTDFSKSVEPLLSILRLYRQNGFNGSALRITQCARNYASGKLARTDALISASRLYEPGIAPSAATGGNFFDLGSTPVVKDYLARQAARSQVLNAYAAPFLSLLQNTDALDDAQRDNGQTAPFWANSTNELNRYLQFKEPNGQVAQLDNLFLKQFNDLNYANCSKILAAYQPAEYGNDMFSRRRQELEEQVRWRCTDSRNAHAYETYRTLATRFNRDLAYRYPFAPIDAPDASPAVVQAFFADYETQRDALHQMLAALKGSKGLKNATWHSVHQFLDRLDAASDFFNNSLSNLSANNLAQALKLTIEFHALPGISPGSEQIVSWSMTSGAQSSNYPNRVNTLDWLYGQPLVLDLTWADRSLWRPVDDLQQRDLKTDGASASFSATGEWALLRMIDTHRPALNVTGGGLDPNRILLEFAVPTIPAGPARLYLALNLTSKDPKTQAPVPLKLPIRFPHHAPQ